MQENSGVFSVELCDKYNMLERLSHQARYKPQYIITAEQVMDAQNCLDVIHSWYKTNK